MASITLCVAVLIASEFMTVSLLQIGVIQLAITARAASGELLFEWADWWSTFALSALFLLGSAFAAWAASMIEGEHAK